MHSASRAGIITAIAAGWLITAMPASAYLKDFTVVSGRSAMGSNPEQVAVAACPPGRRILGGGGSAVSASSLGVKVLWPSRSLNRFFVTGTEARSTNASWGAFPQAFCATETGTPPSSNTPATYVNDWAYAEAQSTPGSRPVQWANARCQTGKSVIGGGGELAPLGGAALAFRFMFRDGDGRGFTVFAQELAPTDAKWGVKAVAICADIANRAVPNQTARVQQVQKTGTSTPDRVKTEAVTCPSGMRVIGGGAQSTGPSSVVLTKSTPAPYLIPGSWSASARNTNPSPIPLRSWQLIVSAICVAPPL